MTGRVPLVDLAAQHAEVAQEVRAGFDAVMAAASFVGGKDVDAFEREYADFLDARHCVGVANGTDAIELALRALRIGAGHEVVLPANTFVATAEAVARTGATPVLADVDPQGLLLDPEAAVAAFTAQTKAVIPVHLYGQAAPVEGLRAAAEAAGVAVVEDAAQSQGATRHGTFTGTLGDIAATSFYPGKNLGAYGDAGAVLTASAELATSVRLLGNHGSPAKYEHSTLGFNSRLDTLQAVVLRAKLNRLAAWNDARRAAAETYDRLLSEMPDVVVPSTLEGNVHVWHLYVVRVPRRDAVLQHLNEAGIGAGIHYPVPVHLQGAFRHLGYAAGAFPVTELAAGQILSLPLFPGITVAQQERVVGELASALS